MTNINNTINYTINNSAVLNDYSDNSKDIQAGKIFDEFRNVLSQTKTLDQKSTVLDVTDEGLNYEKVIIREPIKRYPSNLALYVTDNPELLIENFKINDYMFENDPTNEILLTVGELMSSLKTIKSCYCEGLKELPQHYNCLTIEGSDADGFELCTFDSTRMTRLKLHGAKDNSLVYGHEYDNARPIKFNRGIESIITRTLQKAKKFNKTHGLETGIVNIRQYKQVTSELTVTFIQFGGVVIQLRDLEPSYNSGFYSKVYNEDKDRNVLINVNVNEFIDVLEGFKKQKKGELRDLLKLDCIDGNYIIELTCQNLGERNNSPSIKNFLSDIHVNYISDKESEVLKCGIAFNNKLLLGQLKGLKNHGCKYCTLALPNKTIEAIGLYQEWEGFRSIVLPIRLVRC